MIIDENTIHIIFSTLAMIFGTLLGLLGISAVFKYDRYENEINKAHNRIVEYKKEIGAAKREGDQEYVNGQQDLVRKSLKNSDISRHSETAN